MPGLSLNHVEADNAVRMFDMLRLPDVPGKPLIRDATGDWMRDIVRAIFGSVDPQTGIRSIREFFVLVPKKSAKTTNAAAIMLVAAMTSRRPNAEFLFVAPTKEIADLAFRQAVGMIEADDVLTQAFHVRDNIKQITYRRTGTFLKVKTFDPSIVTGSKPAGVMLDELHVMAEMHDADRVIGQLRGGLISQPEAFMLTITTQSERPPVGVFKTELDMARNVRDGKVQASLLPVIYEFPPDVDWRNPDNWWMVTPNLGRSVSLDSLRDGFERAKIAGEAEFRRWASQHLNIEVGVALRDNAWAGAQFWEAAEQPHDLDELLERSEVVTIGIDGGGLDDLLGLYVIGREIDSGRWLGWGHAWAHPSVLERRLDIAPAIRTFAGDGDLTIVNQIGEDSDELGDIVEKVNESGLLDRIGCDPAGIGTILDTIEARGVPKDRIVGISQGWRLGGAIKTAERRLASGDLIPSAQALMRWTVGNARVEQRANSILVTKQASQSAKIDALMALFCAAELMSRNPAAARGALILAVAG